MQCSLPGSLSSHSGKFLQTVAPSTPSVHRSVVTEHSETVDCTLGCTQLLKLHPKRQRGAFFPSPTRHQPQARPGFTTLITVIVYLTVVLTTLIIIVYLTTTSLL